MIHKVGPNVKDFEVGDIAVVEGSMAGDGAFAEYSLHKADVVVNLTKLFPNATKEQLIEKSIDFAAIPTVGGTAYYILIRNLKIHLNKELKNIVITAGSGGVGGAMIQLTKILRPDIKIIVTCSSQNFEYVKKLGADICIDYRTQNVKEELFKITNNVGVDAFVDMVDQPDEGMKCLRFGGELVCVSATAKEMNYAFENAISIHHVFYAMAHTVKYDERPRKELYEFLKQLCIYYWEKKYDPMIGEVIGFEGVKDALKKLKQRHVRGKIVVSFK